MRTLRNMRTQNHQECQFGTTACRSTDDDFVKYVMSVIGLNNVWNLAKIFQDAKIYSEYTTPCLTKNSQNCFPHNFVKCLLNLIIFGKKMAKTIESCNKHSFSTSP